MPRNPSSKQRIASAKNLEKNYGPKTPAGKAISALNGKKNKGAKTAKARARILNARWKEKGGIKGTFYDLSGCLHCQKVCPGRSFSQNAVISDYSFACFSNVIAEHNHTCFYYFHGLCGVRYNKAELPDNYCIIDDQNLTGFGPETDKNRYNDELGYRRKFMKLKAKLSAYLENRVAGDDPFPTEICDVIKELREIFSSYKMCKMEVKEFSELNEHIQDLVYDPYK
jgi:hypothetical protein